MDFYLKANLQLAATFQTFAYIINYRKYGTMD